MPAPPLIDFDALDLSRVVVGPSEIREVCKQRNRFEMIDGVLLFDTQVGLMVGFKDLSPNDWWASDHIPGRPIFPGVLQIEAAAQLCTYHFLTTQTHLREKFVGFAGLNETRFRGLVTPPARLIIAAKQLRVRQTMFTYQAQGFVDKKLVLETEILGVIV